MTLAPVYALYVTHERRAAAELAEAGFSAWAPTYRKLREARDIASIRRASRGHEAWSRQMTTDVPLYPGYVFARIPVGSFHLAKACEHVTRIITSGDGSPCPVPEQAFGDMLVLVLSGRLDEGLPSIKARPRGVRRRGLNSLNEWFAAAAKSARAYA